MENGAVRGQWTTAHEERYRGGQVETKRETTRGISYSAIGCSNVGGDFESRVKVLAAANMFHAVLCKTAWSRTPLVL